jgi:hypothetical protein
MSRWKRRRQRQQRTTNPTPTSGDFFVSEVRTFCMSVDTEIAESNLLRFIPDMAEAWEA